MKRIALVLAIATGTTGCSLALTRKPSAGATCTKSRVPAVLDTSVAIAAAATVVVAMLAIDSESQAREGVAGGAALGGVLFAASAGNGWERSSDCRAASAAR